MKWEIEDIVRPNIKSLIPYASARDEYSGDASVYLDANENPYNTPLNRYPDPKQNELKARLSQLKSISEENIFLGNGSDEAIDLLFRIFCEPGIDNAVTIDPSYGMYSVCANINNVEIRKVELNPDFSLDAERLLKSVDEKTKLIFLCSPNNPTSNLLNESEVLKLVKSARTIVVIDEAYIDFSSSPGFSNRIKDFPNLVVLQTLSKAWALAGIRLGMAIADKLIISYMSKVKYPYNINRLTIEKAIEELQNTELRSDWIKTLVKERLRLEKELKRLPFVEKVYPSDANFLLVKTEGAKDIYKYLLTKGIIIRDRSGIPLCEGALRITVGSRVENDKLIETLKLKS